MAPWVPDANRRPPSPRGLPLIGNLHQLGSLPHRSLRSLAAAHGPVMLIRLGQVPVVVVSSASAAREVLQAQDLLSPPRVRAYRAVREQEVDALLEESNVLLGAFHVGDYIPWLSWVSYVDGTDARVTRAFETIDRILDEIVDAAATRETPLSGEEASDDAFIHVLLSLQQKEPTHAGTAEWRLSRDNVKALLEDLFGAGTEATIIVLEWAMAELLRNKEVMQKLQREATRISHGYDIPRDTMVIVNAWAIARDPEAWESPEEFRPERFVGSGVDFGGQHFQLIPFGAGRRMCPGIDFAMSVVQLALANLVARFDWALPEGEAELDMQETAGCSSRNSAPLCAVATQRCFC
ncbi:unnamed protein product [Miscanthus lutarioriparius]|uniref:Cytochrome P450 71A1 n=1 Tax=Miscanthus lutarioriparius TaxID=422564 RepID=A0A811PRU0_9POAL|nr:unnamed protein product [Miscanthus lutarioriparius]